MADNVTTQSSTLATIPASTAIAADDISSVYYQRVKLTLGPNGTNTADAAGVDLGSGAGGLYVRPRLGTVIVSTPQNSSGLTTASTNYSPGDTLGAGWVVANAANTSGGTGTIVGVDMKDYSDIVTTLALYFFQGSVTFGTDNVAPSISDADSLKHVGEPVTVTFVDLGGVRVGGTGGLSIPYVLDGTDLYVYAVAGTIAASFFGAATDLKLRVAVRPD